MVSPFPGMDPFLENPAIWPDVHNSLIAAIRDGLGPVLRPRYVVRLEERTYRQRTRVSPGNRRPLAELRLFSLRDSIPRFSLPLLAGDEEPEVENEQHGV